MTITPHSAPSRAARRTVALAPVAFVLVGRHLGQVSCALFEVAGDNGRVRLLCASWLRRGYSQFPTSMPE